MIKEIYGKKIGMTQVFDSDGNQVPVTLIEIEPVCVLEKIEYSGKTKAKIGCFKVKGNRVGRVKKPEQGYFKKLGISPYKSIREVSVEEGADFSFREVNIVQDEQKQDSSDNIQEVSKKQDSEAKDDPKFSIKKDDILPVSKDGFKRDLRQIGVEIFKKDEIVDVRARSKGKGFSGGMKRHGWSGQPGSHGSTTHRRVGSVGASAYPSKIIKGKRMPGHMGNVFTTTKKLKIIKIDEEKEIIFIKGSVPGARGTVVRIKKIN